MANVKTQLVIEGKNNTKKAFGELHTSLAETNSKLKAAGDLFKLAFSGGLIVGAARQLSTMADASTNMESKLKLATSTQQGFNLALADVRRIADENGASVTAVTQLYARLSPALREAGRSQEEVALVTEAVTKALRISGASATESEGALLQFAQALGSGALRGDEFNSVAEAAPRLMKALADSLGVGTGALKDMAKNGELTAQVVTEALLSQLPQLSKEAEEMGATFELSGQRLANASVRMTGELDKITGASEKTTNAMNDLAEAMARVSNGEFIDSFNDQKQTVGGMNIEISKLLKKLNDLQQDKNTAANGTWLEKMLLSWRGMTETGIWLEEQATNKQLAALRKRLAQKTGVDAEISEEERAHGSRISKLKDEQLKALEANLAGQEKAEKNAKSRLEKLKNERLKIEQDFNASINSTRAGAAGESTFATAMDLKMGAKNALGNNDGERAVQQAREALGVLEQLEAAGVNTYGFVGIKEELKGIALAGSDLQSKGVTDELAAIKWEMADLSTSIKNMPKVKVGFEYADEDDAAIRGRIATLASDLKAALTITPVITAPAGTRDADVPVAGYATGGRVRGPGTGTSDSIMARLSNGEFVMRAAAVRAYGPALLEKMNGLRIPKFADGGLVGAAMSAPVGQSGRDLGRVDLNIGGETISLLADQQNFTDLVKRQSWKRGSTRR